MKTWRVSTDSSEIIEADTAEAAIQQFIDDLDATDITAELESDDEDDEDEDDDMEEESNERDDDDH